MCRVKASSPSGAITRHAGETIAACVVVAPPLRGRYQCTSAGQNSTGIVIARDGQQNHRDIPGMQAGAAVLCPDDADGDEDEADELE